MAMATTSELLNPFSALTFHSHGSPAPWQTASPSLPLHLRTLVSATLSLSNALAEASDQLETVRSLLARAGQSHSQLRHAVFDARDRVLVTSRQAQAAHAEAKRVDLLEHVFRRGADRAVASLDRRVLRALRKGKMRVVVGGQVAVEDEFDAVNFVEELLIDLDVELKEVTRSHGHDSASGGETGDDDDDGGGALGLELDEEWLAMQDELVARLATKARERGSPSFRRTSLWRRQRRASQSDASTTGESDGATTDGDNDADEAHSDAGSDRISSPSTPPSSVHSTDDSELESLPDDTPALCLDDNDGDETVARRRCVVAPPAAQLPPMPDYDTLVELVTPLIHPVLLLLFRLRHVLSLKLTTAIDAFETLVKASADAVETHRDAVARLNKNAAKIRDLKDLEQRECDEEERLLGELRGVVVELARMRLHPTRYSPYDDIDELSEEENDDVE